MASIAAGAAAANTVGADPRVMQWSSHFQNANEGPATIAAKISGVNSGGKREDDGPYFTNNESSPFPDPAHSKTVGGLPLVSDTFLLQKQQTFNRSKNLERMVHPCGSGAFGYFETTKNMSGLTKANFLRDAGVKTSVFARFSTVTLGREFPDSARNPRGFALKLYTGEGNYDIVGLNFPIFFCRDPIQRPDVIRSQARSPKNFLLDYNSLFDLLANSPEGNHAGMMFFSHHGTPVGWRHEHGYRCHTFKWVNQDGKFVYIKYHFLADGGQKQFSMPEAIKTCGEDPDFAKRELWDAIENGERVSWTAHVQIMEPDEADPTKLGFDPFDLTKVWPRDQFPMHEFGSMVPGIEDSPDPLLQFRMFFYRDAQYHRIGVNLHQVPVNCPFMSGSLSGLNFDGQMRNDANHGGKPQYYPNSFTHKFRPDTAETPYSVADNVVSRKSHYYHEGKMSEYTQATELYKRVMSETAKDHLHTNTATLLNWVTEPIIQSKYLAQVYCIAPEYALAVYDLLKDKKFDFSEVKARSADALTMGKETRFMPSEGDKLVGYPAPDIYNP